MSERLMLLLLHYLSIRVIQNQKINKMDLRTIGTLIFYVVLLGVSFWVGSLLERNERKYKKYFKED